MVTLWYGNQVWLRFEEKLMDIMIDDLVYHLMRENYAVRRLNVAPTGLYNKCVTVGKVQTQSTTIILHA